MFNLERMDWIFPIGIHPKNPARKETSMIDPETIEDIDDCDGESIFAYGFDHVKKSWEWAWVPIEHVAECGRSDIVDRLFPRYDDDDEG